MDAKERDRARLLKAVLEQGTRGRFVAIVDLLERLFPDAARVGLDGPPRLEALRFRSDVSLGFAAGDIKSLGVERVPNPLGPDRHVIRLEATFLGLSGSSSPLPSYLVEALLDDSGDSSIRRDFLDVFHHRLLSLFYRGLARTTVPREETASVPSIWRRRALALGGIDTYDAPFTKVLPQETVLRMLPLFVGRARSARALRTALRHVLRPALGPHASVDLVENLPGWLEIEPAHRVQLGKANNVLGRSMHIGTRAPERSGRFGVRIGPLDLDNYARFLPGGDQLPLLRETVQLLTRTTVEYDVQLVVGAKAAPAFTLSAARPAPLGRTTWLAGSTMERVVTVPHHADAEPTPPSPPSN
jgi:type VI secretion system protein ImpH